MLKIGLVVHDLTHSPVYEEGQEVHTHITMITPFMDVLLNGPPYFQHELNELISKIFSHVQIFSVVHLHERSTRFCIKICDVHFPFLFTLHD